MFVDSRSSIIVLRHDVDRLPQNSLKTAQIEHELGIHGSYYFRIVPESFDEKIIREIAALGHEIGYHYEDVDLAARAIKGKSIKAKGKSEESSKSQDPRSKNQVQPGTVNYEPGTVNYTNSTLHMPQMPVRGISEHPRNSDEIEDIENCGTPHSTLYQTALQLFEKHLQQLREIVPIDTICMHGSPRSRYDNRSLWEYYDYRDYGIIGEPYFDIDFTQVLYLTDTGRRWDGKKVSIRDKEGAGKEKAARRGRKVRLRPGAGTSADKRDAEGAKGFLSEQYNFRSTFDIIRAAEEGRLPERIMITVHPQRWSDEVGPWVKELVWQNMKNVVKRMFLLIRKA